MINVKKLEVGYLKENCYILTIGNKCLIIDPGDDYKKIKNEIENLSVLGILVTHNHFDHIGCVNDFVNEYNIKVFDYNNLNEQQYKIGPFVFNVIFTPGHSNDSICYYFENDNIMFVGDFIFKNNIGRCDLPGGNINMMYKSISKIKEYPDVIIFPGHGSVTSLDIEKKNNPFFKIEQL